MNTDANKKTAKKTYAVIIAATFAAFAAITAAALVRPIQAHAEEPQIILTQEQIDQIAQILYQQSLEQQGKSATQPAVQTPVAKPKAAATAPAPVTTTADTNGYALLGSYNTKYNAKIPRATNVALAASRINGVVVNPGDLFSFTTTILPRTAANGYVEAPVIVNKEFVPGMGGGICQVSSTLYACMLTSGVPATERHPHSLPVSYIPAGMDATISGTAVDLKFINTFDKPMMISASADNGSLTVGLWLRSW